MRIGDLREFYVAGIGKEANHKVNLLNPRVNSLHLRTGFESGVLVVDVDNPHCEYAKKVRGYMRKDDFIVYSSQYTLNDVFEGKCKFKVFYEWNGKRLPKKKANEYVEILYGKTYLAGFAGKRGDGYEYVISSLCNKEIKPLHFDVNDVVQVKIKEFDLFKTLDRDLITIENEVKDGKETAENVQEQDPDSLGYETVDIIEFQKLLREADGEIEQPRMIKRGEVLTFNCMFPHLHSDLKNANAYAFKKEGQYYAKCHGSVCRHEYMALNKKLKEVTVNKLVFEGCDGFSKTSGENVTLFKAPTGWGKTEAIAEEVLKAITNKEKLLIILQSKEAIARLSSRINEKSNGYFQTLYNMGKIYIYTSENKTDEHELNVENANVIISHHYYFINAGNVLTYYKDSMAILEQPLLKVIIDEAHTYIELASRMDIEVGGLYHKDAFAGMDIWVSNTKPLSAFDVKDDPNFAIKTDCMIATMNEFHSVELRKEYRLYEGVKYLDIVSHIKNSKDYKMIDMIVENETEFEVYENTNVKAIRENSLENEALGMELLVGSAERVIIGYNNGDTLKRKKIGNISFTAYHKQILAMVLTKPHEIILTTATFEQYHNDIVRSITDFETHEIKEEIDKVGKIVLLRANDIKPARIKDRVLETTNDLNARALLFFPTIEKAREVAKMYDNIMLNDNGMYAVGRRKSSLDYLDNFIRNVTVAGLESSVAKGYNYLEEVDGNTEGFELIYFDKKPVSPAVIKKYFDGQGNVVDYQSDYHWSAFAQAIGRAFRKSKDVLCIAINDVGDSDYMIIKKYLKQETKAEIVEDDLNIMNLKIATSSFIKSVGIDVLKERLKDNRLFKRIYLN